MTPDRMSDDRIRAVFDEPITPLAAPPGLWERIERDAARRRRNRRLLTAGSVAAAVALVGVLGTWYADMPDRDTVRPAPGPSVTAPPTVASPSTTPSPQQSPTASASTPAPLPKGGAVPAGFVAVSASTTSGGYLYALGTAPCSAAPCTSVVRSHDGGATWVGIPAPRADLPAGLATGTLSGVDPGAVRSTDEVSEIRFATPRDGWAFGGGLWVTHDGGATWKQVRGLKGRVLDLVVDGDSVLYATTTCIADGCPLGVQLTRAPADGRGGSSPERMVRTGAREARFSAGSGTVLLTVGPAPETTVYVVHDGTPVPLTSPCPTAAADYLGGLLAVLPPAGGGKGLVGFCGDPGAGNLQVTTRRSTDGGRTWSTIGSDLRITNGVFSATAVTVDRLVAASGHQDLGGSMHVSYQGGREWFDTAEPAPDEGWRWVAAAGGDRVLALPLVATGSIWVSTDGGATFAPRPIR